MWALCQDLEAEHTEWAALLATLDADTWRRPTVFFDWTPWDQLAHICLLDEASVLAATDAGAFARQAAALRTRRAAGEEISAIARATYAKLDGPALLRHWRDGTHGVSPALLAAMAQRAPRDRLPWFGPEMSARSFATARLMETWAHGQDVWDLLRRPRPATARLRHIATLGVNTYAWSFANRGLTVPEPAPHIRLHAPDGAVWEWNAPSDAHHVYGTAADLCRVVTQRRHVADTTLQVAGNGAAWLAIAQCFAGPPADGPAPGLRRLHGVDDATT